jgi:hypothetical protein
MRMLFIIMISLTHITGCIGVFIGSCLQQNSHFMFSMLSTSKSLKKLNTLLLTLGVCLEIASIAVIPLSTYVLLTSLHISVFKHILISDEKRNYSSAETFGTMGILSGSIIVILFGGMQLEFSSYEYYKIYDLYYFTYTGISLAFSLFFRRLGYFSGRIIVETGLSAQVGSFFISGIKIVWLSLEVVDSVDKLVVVGLCLCIIFLSLMISNSFIREFTKDNDLVIVMGGYYIWSICYCLPISMFIDIGVDHTLINKCAVAVSTFLIVPGIYLHSFYKIEYLKAYKEKKQIKVRKDFIV